MLWPSRKKMTAKKTTNRNCLIPNEGGFRPAGPVVFSELAIDLILTTSANPGAARQGRGKFSSWEDGSLLKSILRRINEAECPRTRWGRPGRHTPLLPRTESCVRFSSALEGYRHSGSDFIASSDVHRGRMKGCLWLSTERPSLLAIKTSCRVSSGKMLVTPLKV